MTNIFYYEPRIINNKIFKYFNYSEDRMWKYEEQVTLRLYNEYKQKDKMEDFIIKLISCILYFALHIFRTIDEYKTIDINNPIIYYKNGDNSIFNKLYVIKCDYEIVTYDYIKCFHCISDTLLYEVVRFANIIRINNTFLINKNYDFIEDITNVNVNDFIIEYNYYNDDKLKSLKFY